MIEELMKLSKEELLEFLEENIRNSEMKLGGWRIEGWNN